MLSSCGARAARMTSGVFIFKSREHPLGRLDENAVSVKNCYRTAVRSSAPWPSARSTRFRWDP